MKKFPKLSQKERKKLVATGAENNGASSPAKAVETAKVTAWSGWATPVVVAGGEEGWSREKKGGAAAVPSLTAIMQVEAGGRSGEEPVR